MSVLGGVFKSLSIVGYLFSLAFSYRLLMASLIRKLFHFKPRFESERKKAKKKEERRRSTQA